MRRTRLESNRSRVATPISAGSGHPLTDFGGCPVGHDRCSFHTGAVASTVRFDRVLHLPRLPVMVAAEAAECRFLLDSGIGVTVVSSSFAARSDVVATAETFAGRRMSGQIVELPLVVLPPVRLGDLVVEDHVAGVLDLGSTQGLTGFDGILSLGFFGAHAYTVDPVGMTLTVGRAGVDPVAGTVVPLEVHRDGPSHSVFAQLVLPSGRTVSVEVDTGSQTLILDERFLGDCGLTAGTRASRPRPGPTRPVMSGSGTGLSRPGACTWPPHRSSGRLRRGCSSRRSSTTDCWAATSSTATESPTTSPTPGCCWTRWTSPRGRRGPQRPRPAALDIAGHRIVLDEHPAARQDRG